MQIFSTLLINARKNAGISQRTLANQLGVKRECISMWEHGKRIPNINMVLRVLSILDINPEEFFK